EIYLEGFGWVVSDVYPQNSLETPPPPPDPELQRILGEMARGQHRDNPVARQVRQQFMDGFGAGARSTTTLLFQVLAAIAALGFAVKLWRRVRPLFSSFEQWPRVAYRAELDRLAEVSVRREPGETREAFAERIAFVAPGFRELTHVHVGAAFGSRRARERAGELRRTKAYRDAARLAPAWRKLLGLLNPYSWLYSR
ncbi:MAG: hypothetical protein H5U40_08995, partial [Polyangiaceae bacterium]|nr:hypothetical protein [Polyangiaceae bacterium]